MQRDTLTTTVRREGSRALVTLSGELSNETADQALDAVTPYLDAGVTGVDFDLSGLTLCLGHGPDCIGRALRRTNGNVRATALSGCAIKKLAQLGLLAHLLRQDDPAPDPCRLARKTANYRAGGAVPAAVPA